jgi:hypothetical protein
MKVGDMVVWRLRFGTDLPSPVGIILEYVDFEHRGRDPFPYWKVFFADQGVLTCRESDLLVVSGEFQSKVS